MRAVSTFVFAAIISLSVAQAALACDCEIVWQEPHETYEHFLERAIAREEIVLNGRFYAVYPDLSKLTGGTQNETFGKFLISKVLKGDIIERQVEISAPFYGNGPCGVGDFLIQSMSKKANLILGVRPIKTNIGTNYTTNACSLAVFDGARR